MTPTRRDLLRFLALGSMAMGGVAMGGTACSTRSSDSGTSDDDPSQTGHHVTWGAFIPQVLPTPGSANDPIEQLSKLAGSQPRYLQRFAAIDAQLPTAELDAIVASGATPMLTLEPWLPGRGINQPTYSLARIAAGAIDAQLHRWATALGGWGTPILLRFAQEMNGNWYPWAVGVNGNTAEHYRAAWARMHSIIGGASNVSFVWSPNVITIGTTDFGPMFPGADVVDHLGLDGYNFGNTTGHHWQPARELFADSLTRLAGLTPDLPLLITEAASADGDTASAKADWIRDFFALIADEPRLQAFCWFQMDKERDWRFNSTPQSAAAFRAGLTALSG